MRLNRITHGTVEVVAGCALLARLLLSGYEGMSLWPVEVGSRVWRTPRWYHQVGQLTGYVVDTLACARWRAADLREAVLLATNLGGTPTPSLRGPGRLREHGGGWKEFRRSVWRGWGG